MKGKGKGTGKEKKRRRTEKKKKKEHGWTIDCLYINKFNIKYIVPLSQTHS